MKNAGRWTDARFRQFIKSALRKLSQRWQPIGETRTRARFSRGIYTCAGYKCDPHVVPKSIRVSSRRINNIFVDHIDPVGETSTWDSYIDRLFCEPDNLQLLCKQCHDNKTREER